MLSTDTINRLLGIKESYQAPSKMLELMLDDKKRNEIFKKFLEHEYQLGYEWFQEYFEDEHADRKNQKQDFTPQSVATLLAALVGENNSHYHETACGNGGILIKHWDEQRLKVGIFKYNPKLFWYHVEELSDRAIPFLIFNMAIRGMNGVVLHGDSLTREFKNVYFIRNMNPFYGYFSEVIEMQKTDILMQELNVKHWMTV